MCVGKTFRDHCVRSATLRGRAFVETSESLNLRGRAFADTAWNASRAVFQERCMRSVNLKGRAFVDTSASLNIRGGAFADAAWNGRGDALGDLPTAWERLRTFRELGDALEDLPRARERLGRPAGRYWRRLGNGARDALGGLLGRTCRKPRGKTSQNPRCSREPLG